jgi:hypothetical protein
MKNWESFCEQFLAIRGSRNYSREIKSLMKNMNIDKTSLKPEDYQWFWALCLMKNANGSSFSSSFIFYREPKP